jgi:hypothetical protein
MFGTNELRTPLLESLDKGEHLLVVDVIVTLSGRELL